MNSAIFTGGLEQLLAALVGAFILAYWYPGDGWARLRVAAFFVGWQAFTPLLPWYIDLPALVACTLVAEVAYCRFAIRRKVRVS